MKKIIIPNQEDLNEKIKKISRKGINNLHILSDFDRTLTKGAVKGNSKVTSIINRIAIGGYLSKDYTEKANKLFDKYHTIEIDLKIPLEEKKKKMQEWWEKHNQLLIDSKLNLNVIKKIIKKEDPHFREGFFDFLKILNEKEIPLLIFSSSRGTMIKLFLEKYNLMDKNIHIIANFFEFNEKGIAIEYNKPVIHVFNKSETSIKELPIYKTLLKKKNVILLGDSLGDVGMIEGFPYENLIKIGFLNKNIEENLEKYKESYDVIILDDGSISYVNELLKKIINKFLKR
jgi:cytosolic 5'-nucleotidase 3